MAKNQSSTDPNILDLRQLIAEQQAAVKRPRRWPSVQRSFGHRSAPVLHRPATPPRDWRLFRRELLKFGVTMVCVGLLTGAVIVASKAMAARASVETTSRAGLENLQAGLAAIGQSQLPEATKRFQQAEREFHDSRDVLRRSSASYSTLPLLGPKIVATDRLLRDAERLSVIGRQLAAILPPDAAHQPAVTIRADGIIQGSVGILASLLEQRESFLSLVRETVAVTADLTTIPVDDLPGDVRERFLTWQRLLSGFVGSGEQVEHLTSVLLGLLAPATPQEYLVVFQNNDELRATGGFLGTFLLVKIENGTFKILDAPGNGPYALSDEIAKVNLPPSPITSVARFWTFHDANWFLDVPTSAETMLDFYAQDRGFAPDGVLFFTPGIMEDLLRITGPVRPEHYQVDITAENFVPATELQVEFGYDKALNNPKQFLIDLVPLMLQKLSKLSGPDALRAIAMTLQRANQGDLLIYSSTAQLQQSVKDLGWDGGLLPLRGDALAVVDTNLGGGKTDRYIDEHVKTTVTLEGSLLRHEVAVTRRHQGPAGDPIHGPANTSFIRVYAPPEAQFVRIDGATPMPSDKFLEPDPAAKLTPKLLAAEGQTLVDSANGFRITHESGRIVFGAWGRIEPGQSQTVTFHYTTPAPNGGGPGTWLLDWQHQPGATVRDWQLIFNLPSSRQASVVNGPGSIDSGKRSVRFTTDSTISRAFSVTYK